MTDIRTFKKIKVPVEEVIKKQEELIDKLYEAIEGPDTDDSNVRVELFENVVLGALVNVVADYCVLFGNSDVDEVQRIVNYFGQLVIADVILQLEGSEPSSPPPPREKMN